MSHLCYIPLIDQFSNEDEQRAWTRGSESGGPEDDRQSDFKIEFYENSRKFKITITFQQEKKLKKNSNINTFDVLLDLVQPVSSSVLGPTWSEKSNHEVGCKSNVIFC